MSRKTILCLCPTAWDEHSIRRQEEQSRYAFLFHGRYAPEHPEQLDVLAFIEETVQRYSGAGIAGVIGTHDYPGSILSAIIAARLGLVGPRPAALLRAQHKLHSRQVQAAACPEVTPTFFPVAPEEPQREDLRFPFFIKPVKVGDVHPRVPARRAGGSRWISRARPPAPRWLRQALQHAVACVRSRRSGCIAVHRRRDAHRQPGHGRGVSRAESPASPASSTP